MKTLSLQLYRLASWTQEIPKYVIFPGTTCAMELVLDMGVP